MSAGGDPTAGGRRPWERRFASCSPPGSWARARPPGCWAQAAPRPQRRAAATNSNGRSPTSRRRSPPPPPGRSRRARRCRRTPAARLKLVPFAEAKLALAPERPPKFSPSYAGAFALDAPAAPAVYKVTLSAGGWIDVIQDGKFLKPIAFSDATGCANARKSVKFRLAAEPATLQLTGVGDPDIAIIVSPE